MREHLIDFGKQHVITHDTVEMNIDALVYFRITDPRLAVLEVANLPDAIELLTQATLRNIIATMTLDDTFSSREKLNQELLFKMRPDAERWVGVFSFFFFFFFFIHYSFVITANTCTHFRIHPFLSFSFSFSFSRSILFLF
jgi:regulator of protease activity HflC (stomatin/prohibitin superfamily)